MLFLLLWFGSSALQRVTSQFAPHMDLQKIDEIMFDNTKYNVLKPTVHITRDHFKDFIQQEDDKDFPGRKLFVDRNGIRHYWTGFEARRPKSFRKTILETNDLPFQQVITSTDKSAVTVKAENDGKIDKGKQMNITKKLEVKRVKNKPLRRKKIIEPDDVDTAANKLALRNDEGKTKVKTTFFCPFFGMVTMVSYLD